LSADPDFPLDVEIAIEHAGWTEADAALAETVLATALPLAGYAIDGPCEISVLLTGDEGQRALNARWRGKDSATNVLSFPQLGADDAIEGLLGDLSLAHETVSREASEQDKPFEAHFAHLLVHGLLHLLGYDHETGQEALAMEARETDILARLGYPDPYGGEEPED